MPTYQTSSVELPAKTAGRAGYDPDRLREHTDFAPLLCTVKQTERLLGLGHTTVCGLIADKKLASVLIGRRRLVRYDSIVALAEGRS